jgi:peptidyl-tRNA hydrolase
MTQKTPYLYILMRTDLASMNPGKAVAQGAHAANQFTDSVGVDEEQFKLWVGETNSGFGTTITLGVTGAQLAHKVNLASLLGFPAGVTHDPTYPLRDGAVTHLIPLDTCGYVFGFPDDLRAILGDLELMA